MMNHRLILIFPPRQDQSCSKWVLCRVGEKNRSQQGVNYHSDHEDDSGTELSWLDEVYLSMDDDLDDIVSMSN